MIKVASINDLDDVMELEYEIFPIDRFSRRTYQRSIQKQHTFLIYYKKQLAGLGSIIFNVLRNKVLKGRIYSVGIHKQFRHRGLGTKLIRYMESEMSNAVYITLEVHSSHCQTIKLYERLGYRKVEDLKDYYSDGNGIRMRKELI